MSMHNLLLNNLNKIVEVEHKLIVRRANMNSVIKDWMAIFAQISFDFIVAEIF